MVLKFRRKPSIFFKSFAIFLVFQLILSLIGETAIYAASAVSVVPADANFLSSDHVILPRELGSTDEYFKGRNGKTIYFVQDAHNSLRAQESIGRIVDYLVDKGVQTVFEEGYEGPVPTGDFFGQIEDPAEREKISYALMDLLRISGAQYAYINQARKFKLIGVDSDLLHWENVKQYGVASRLRSELHSDLRPLLKDIRKISQSQFPKEFKKWFKLKQKWNSGETDLKHYLVETVRLYKKTLEDERNIALLPNVTLLLSEGQDSQSQKPLDSVAFFKELNQIEEKIADAFLKSIEQQKIYAYLNELVLLERLADLRMTQAEFEAVQENLRQMSTQTLADFISKKLKRSVAFSSRWELQIREAIHFYELASQRDHAAQEPLKSFLHQSAEKEAILVFGGFHKENIKHFLREAGFSYLIISPAMEGSDEIHSRYYEQLMSDGFYAFEGPAPSAESIPPRRFFQMITPDDFLAYLNRIPSRYLPRSEMRAMDIRYPVPDRFGLINETPRVIPHEQISDNNILHILKRNSIDPDDFEVLVYPAAGNQDDHLIVSLLRSFRNLREVHLVSLSYQSTSELLERWQKNLQRQAVEAAGREVNVQFHAEDYLTFRVPIQAGGRRIVIDKFPDENGLLRVQQKFYQGILNDSRPGDLIMTVQGGHIPYQWKGEIARRVSVPQYSKWDWTLSLVLNEDRSAVDEWFHKAPQRAEVRPLPTHVQFSHQSIDIQLSLQDESFTQQVPSDAVYLVQNHRQFFGRIRVDFTRGQVVWLGTPGIRTSDFTEVVWANLNKFRRPELRTEGEDAVRLQFYRQAIQRLDRQNEGRAGWTSRFKGAEVDHIAEFKKRADRVIEQVLTAKTVQDVEAALSAFGKKVEAEIVILESSRKTETASKLRQALERLKIEINDFKETLPQPALAQQLPVEDLSLKTTQEKPRRPLSRRSVIRSLRMGQIVYIEGYGFGVFISRASGVMDISFYNSYGEKYLQPIRETSLETFLEGYIVTSEEAHQKAAEFVYSLLRFVRSLTTNQALWFDENIRNRHKAVIEAMTTHPRNLRVIFDRTMDLAFVLFNQSGSRPQEARSYARQMVNFALQQNTGRGIANALWHISELARAYQQIPLDSGDPNQLFRDAHLMLSLLFERDFGEVSDRTMTRLEVEVLHALMRIRFRHRHFSLVELKDFTHSDLVAIISNSGMIENGRLTQETRSQLFRRLLRAPSLNGLDVMVRRDQIRSAVAQVEFLLQHDQKRAVSGLQRDLDRGELRKASKTVLLEREILKELRRQSTNRRRYYYGLINLREFGDRLHFTKEELQDVQSEMNWLDLISSAEEKTHLTPVFVSFSGKHHRKLMARLIKTLRSLERAGGIASLGELQDASNQWLKSLFPGIDQVEPFLDLVNQNQIKMKRLQLVLLPQNTYTAHRDFVRALIALDGRGSIFEVAQLLGISHQEAGRRFDRLDYETWNYNLRLMNLIPISRRIQSESKIKQDEILFALDSLGGFASTSDVSLSLGVDEPEVRHFADGIDFAFVNAVRKRKGVFPLGIYYPRSGRWNDLKLKNLEGRRSGDLGEIMKDMRGFYAQQIASIKEGINYPGAQYPSFVRVAVPWAYSVVYDESPHGREETNALFQTVLALVIEVAKEYDLINQKVATKVLGEEGPAIETSQALSQYFRRGVPRALNVSREHLHRADLTKFNAAHTSSSNAASEPHFDFLKDQLRKSAYLSMNGRTRFTPIRHMFYPAFNGEKEKYMSQAKRRFLSFQLLPPRSYLKRFHLGKDLDPSLRRSELRSGMSEGSQDSIPTKTVFLYDTLDLFNKELAFLQNQPEWEQLSLRAQFAVLDFWRAGKRPLAGSASDFNLFQWQDLFERKASHESLWLEEVMRTEVLPEFSLEAITFILKFYHYGSGRLSPSEWINASNYFAVAAGSSAVDVVKERLTEYEREAAQLRQAKEDELISRLKTLENLIIDNAQLELDVHDTQTLNRLLEASLPNIAVSFMSWWLLRFYIRPVKQMLDLETAETESGLWFRVLESFNKLMKGTKRFLKKLLRPLFRLFEHKRPRPVVQMMTEQERDMALNSMISPRLASQIRDRDRLKKKADLLALAPDSRTSSQRADVETQRQIQDVQEPPEPFVAPSQPETELSISNLNPQEHGPVQLREASAMTALQTKQQRQQMIQEKMKLRSVVSVADIRTMIVDAFNRDVSESTIRRDLNQLLAGGDIKKVVFKGRDGRRRNYYYVPSSPEILSLVQNYGPEDSPSFIQALQNLNRAAERSELRLQRIESGPFDHLDVTQMLRNITIPMMVYIDFDEFERTGGFSQDQINELFAWAYYVPEKIRIVIYNADPTHDRLKSFWQLVNERGNVRIYSEDAVSAVALSERDFVSGFDEYVRLHLSKVTDRLRKDLPDLYFFRYTRTDHRSGLLAASILWANFIDHPRRQAEILDVFSFQDGYYMLTQNFLRDLYELRRAEMVVSMYA